jgi:hypothetical protein
MRSDTPFGRVRKACGSLIAARSCVGSEVSKSTRANFTIEVTGMWPQPARAMAVQAPKEKQELRAHAGFTSLTIIIYCITVIKSRVNSKTPP